MHVWRCDLDATIASPDVLDDTERARAAAFAFDHHRRRYMTAHCFLRGTLAHHLQLDPARIELATTAYGKPYLRHSDLLHFNLSHAEGIAYLAISEISAVGIDVELDHRIEDAIEVGRTVFSAAEMSELCPLSGTALDDAFLRCWTRKESYVKALGLGIGQVDLCSITVGTQLAPIEVPAIPGVSITAKHVRTLEVAAGEHVAVTSSVPVSSVVFGEFSHQLFF